MFVIVFLYETFNYYKDAEDQSIDYSWSMLNNTPLEVVWTIFPILVLFFIAFPSFSLL